MPKKPSRISGMPATVPSHQALLMALASTDLMMSSVPRKMGSRPRIEASVQNASYGWANDHPAPKAKMTPIAT
jgi:hypothetical protein